MSSATTSPIDIQAAPGGGEATLDADTFGRALYDTFNDGGAASAIPQVVELSNGHIAVGRMGRYFESGEELGYLDRWALERATGRILDIGAGVGRHSLVLQERGFEVVALDPSPRAVAVCGERGVGRVACASVEEMAGRVRSGEEAPFDTLLLLGNNIGLSASREKAGEFWPMLRSMVGEGGRVVGTCRNPYDTREEYDLAYQEANLAAGRLGGQMTMRVRHKHFVGPWFEYLFCGLTELEEMLAGSGWEIVARESLDDSYAVELRAV